MKLIVTLLLFLLVQKAGATWRAADSLPLILSQMMPVCGLAASTASEETTTVRVRCGTITDKSRPLIVIDGVPVEYEIFEKLDPNDIAEISVLKEAAAAKLYSNRPNDGVILITTKAIDKFTIRDFLNGEPIPGASVILFSGNDSLKGVANDKGVWTGSTKPGLQYTIIVSSAGYKNLSIPVNRKGQVILLQRDIKECEEVTVRAYTNTIGCRRTGSIIKVTGCGPGDGKTETTRTTYSHRVLPKTTVPFLYPNPIQRSQSFNIEWESHDNETIQVSVMSLNGKTLLTQSQKAIKGQNRLSLVTDNRWAAGIYIVQLRDGNGKLLKNEKLVIQ